MSAPNLRVTEIKAFVPAKDFELSKTASPTSMRATRASCSKDFCAEGAAENFTMHLLVEDVDAWRQRIVESGVVQTYGVTLSPIEYQPWRMRDFCVTDPSGVAWRVAQNVD